MLAYLYVPWMFILSSGLIYVLTPTLLALFLLVRPNSGLLIGFAYSIGATVCAWLWLVATGFGFPLDSLPFALLCGVIAFAAFLIIRFLKRTSRKKAALVGAAIVLIPLAAPAYVLFDARLMLNACRVPGVPDAYYVQTGEEAVAFLKREQSEFRSKYGRDDNKGPTEIVQLNPDIPPFDRFLAAWFKHKQPQLKTVGDKLALMDATFRAVPMQFDGLWRSNSRVGTQSVPVFGYRFSWREPGDRLGSYRPYNLMWRDVGGELGEFVDAYAQPPGFLTNVMQRSPMPGATLCPEAPRTP